MTKKFPKVLMPEPVEAYSLAREYDRVVAANRTLRKTVAEQREEIAELRVLLADALRTIEEAAGALAARRKVLEQREGAHAPTGGRADPAASAQR